MSGRPVESLTKIDVGKVPSTNIEQRSHAFDIHYHDFESLLPPDDVPKISERLVAKFECFGYQYGLYWVCNVGPCYVIFLVRHGDPNLGDAEIECSAYSLDGLGKARMICGPQGGQQEAARRRFFEEPGQIAFLSQSLQEQVVKPETLKWIFRLDANDITNSVKLDGTLVLRLFISKSSTSLDEYVTPFIPKNPFSMGKFCMDEATADVSFRAGEEVIYAHRLILQSNAPTLAELCEDRDKDTPVLLSEITPWILRQFMAYIYGGEVEWPTETAQGGLILDILKAANRYNVSSLKVEAEARLVRSTKVNLDSFAENYILADSLKLPLLKEKVMKFVVDNGTAVLGAMSDLPQSETMMRDVLHAVVARDEAAKDDEAPGVPEVPRLLSVDVLRRRLAARGLSVDGTREMLVAALEGCSSTTSTST